MLSDLWYKNAIFYSLDVETFFDSDSDGCGDFEGLSRRLDYLEGLGVDAIWLAPFQPSPDRDDGYDITDYYGVDQRYGTLGDFVEFVHQAESRGIRVIVDLVVNHTSNQHSWFREASADASSSFRDWYVWAKKRPRDWRSGLVFPGVQQTTWTYARGVRKYYFHRFYDFEPDLNIENPQVREEIRRIVGFWLELGIAGFRVDAVPFLLEKPSPTGGRSALDFSFLKELREFLQWRVGDAVLLGEANVPPGDSRAYFAAGDGLHMMFNFWVNQHLFYALASGDARPLAQALRATARLPQSAQWALFLRNHDELDLGRLPKDHREACFAVFAPEPDMQLYGRGIRRRLAPMLADPKRIQLAYSLLFSLPGTPVIRYGEEIGMGEDLALKERYAIRTPMQWSEERNGGFSTAEETVFPVLKEGPYGYEHVNVAKQQRDPQSLLRWLTRLIRLRKECPEIGWGDWRVLPIRHANVLALEYQWRGTSLICIHNLSAQPAEIRVPLQEPSQRLLVNLIEDEASDADETGVHRVALDSFAYKWYRVDAINPALPRRRTNS